MRPVKMVTYKGFTITVWKEKTGYVGTTKEGNKFTGLRPTVEKAIGDVKAAIDSGQVDESKAQDDANYPYTISVAKTPQGVEFGVYNQNTGSQWVAGFGTPGKAKAQQMIDRLKKKKKTVDEDVNSTASAGEMGYDTPKAFSATGKVSKKMKKTAQQLGMELVKPKFDREHGSTDQYAAMSEDINTSIILRRQFKDIMREGLEKSIPVETPIEEMSPRKQIYELTRKVRQQVEAIESTFDKMINIKNEQHVSPDDYYKRTHAALRKINEKVVKMIHRMNAMK